MRLLVYETCMVQVILSYAVKAIGLAWSCPLVVAVCRKWKHAI